MKPILYQLEFVKVERWEEGTPMNEYKNMIFRASSLVSIRSSASGNQRANE